MLWGHGADAGSGKGPISSGSGQDRSIAAAGGAVAGTAQVPDRATPGAVEIIEERDGSNEEKGSPKGAIAGRLRGGSAGRREFAEREGLGTCASRGRENVREQSSLHLYSGWADCIGLTSRVYFDAGGYSYHPNSAATTVRDLNDGVNVRQARIGVLGTFLSDWNYALVYDFGGSSDGFGNQASGPNATPPSSGPLPGGQRSGIENAYLQFTGLEADGVSSIEELGYINVPYTLDQSTSSNDIMFMERASAQITAVDIAAGDFRSAGGTRVYTDRFWAGAYATGPRSGAIHNLQSTATVNGSTEQFGSTGRIAYQLLQEKDYTLHIGGDAEFLFKPPVNTTTGIRSLPALSDRPELRIDPTALISTGTITNVSGAQVYSGELAGTYGPLFVQGEYFWFDINRQFGLPGLNFQGGYAEAGLTLTGESRNYIPATGSYGLIVPKDPFSVATGGLGAFEIAARYSVMNLNDLLGNVNGIAGGKQSVFTAGLNWYATRNIEFTLNYLHGIVDKQTTGDVRNSVSGEERGTPTVAAKHTTEHPPHVTASCDDYESTDGF
jgi:phosphate-selective porin OprO/OprP